MKIGQWAIFVLVALPIATITGCMDEGGGAGELKFVDPLGAEVILEHYPERIVTLSPALTETLFALGLGGKVVATDDSSDHPPEAAALPDVFSYLGLDLESLISVDPDLVFVDRTLDLSEAAYSSIKGAGIPVFRIYPRSIEDVLETIEGIGRITDSQDEAGELLNGFVERAGRIEAAIAGWGTYDRPKVLLVTYYDGTSDPWISTDTTMSGGLIEAAGGRNAISDDTGMVVQVPVETVVGADPDLIICTQSASWPTQTRNTILSDDRWKDIGAVMNDRVYEVDGDLVDRTGPRLIQGLEEIHAHVAECVGE